MSARPWMPLYIGDYLADTSHLTTIEHGAYLLLILHYWANDGLPGDDRQLKNIAKMSSHNWKKIRPTLEKLFEDGWRHKRIDDELRKARDIAVSRKEAANKRHGKTSAKAPANAEQKQTQSQPQPQSHKKEDSLAHSRSGLFEKTDLPDEPKPDGWPKNYRDQFWDAYPKKVGKIAALKTLERVRASGTVSFEKLMAGVQRYRSERPPGFEPQFTCAAQRWLNEGRWDDEPGTHATGRQNGFHGERAPRGGEAIDAGVGEVKNLFPWRHANATDAAGQHGADEPRAGGNPRFDVDLPPSEYRARS